MKGVSGMAQSYANPPPAHHISWRFRALLRHLGVHVVCGSREVAVAVWEQCKIIAILGNVNFCAILPGRLVIWVTLFFFCYPLKRLVDIAFG